MKPVFFFCIFSLACAGAMAQSAIGANRSAETVSVQAQDHAGFLKSVQGQVQLITTDGTVRSAKAGDKMMPTERIVSGADGAVSLVMRDGTSMVLGPSSQFEIKQFVFNATAQEGNVFVSLVRGSMRMISGLIGKTNPEAVRIDTQTATIGIRGTDFIVLADVQL
jgi:hypothetical protein